MIEIRNISKSFQKRKILDDISLNIKSNQIFGLVGLNGIGKTTLIKIILDMLYADNGEVLINGVSSKNFKSRQNICFLPEKFHPSPSLKGYEFLEISLSFFNKSLDFPKAVDLAKRLDLNPNVLNGVIGDYSKGMGQKLGLLSCFLSDANVLILDEPMSGLDPKSRIMLKNEMRDYKNQGKTIFFSSHILADIDELCDEIGIIHNTKIIYNGDTNSFKQQFNDSNLEKAFLNSISV